jgi:WD40 repeat protein
MERSVCGRWLPTAKSARPLTGHRGWVESVAFSLDGTMLVSASDDHTLRLWDVAKHRQIGAPLTGHTDVVKSVSSSPDGKTLASAGDDSTVRLWDVATHRQIGDPLAGFGGRFNCVSFSPDGTTLASAGEDRAISLWNTYPVSYYIRQLCGTSTRGTRPRSGLRISPQSRIRSLASVLSIDSLAVAGDRFEDPLGGLGPHIWAGVNGGHAVSSGSRPAAVPAWDRHALGHRAGRRDRRLCAFERPG